MALLPSENQRALHRHSRFLCTGSDLNLSLVDKISLLSIGKWNFKGREVGFSQGLLWEANHSRYLKQKGFNAGC